MSILYWLVEYGASFLELFIAYRVISQLFGVRRKAGNIYTDIILAVCCAGIVIICNNVVLTSFVTTFIVWGYLSVSIKYMYKISGIAAFSMTSFYLLCVASMDFLGLTLVRGVYHKRELSDLLSQQSPERVGTILFVKGSWVLIYICIRKYLRNITVNIKGAYLTLVMSFIGFWGFGFMLNQALEAFNPTMPIMWFTVSAFLFAIVFIVYFICARKQDEFRMDLLEVRNKLLNEKYDSINDIYRDNAKLYHDLDNHMNMLYHFLNDGNLDKAKEYIHEMSKPILNLSQTVWTGVDVVDVVINSKLQKMKESDILPDINVEFPKNSNISPNDLCSILSNILDNAIEAAVKIKTGRYINITIRRINYFLFIRITNPCKSVKKFDILPATTKKETHLHGWGLQSVSDVIKKYEGMLELVNQNGEFTVKIMLPFDDHL